MKRRNYSIILMPLVIAVSLCIGIYLGTNISNNGRLSPVYDKLSTILALIQNDYVDTVDIIILNQCQDGGQFIIDRT